MPRPVLTARDLDNVPPGGAVTVTPDTLITPLAREEAEHRGITIRVEKPASPTGRVLAFGADHGGFELKQRLASWAASRGYQVLDLGTNSSESVDYPDFAEAVAAAVARGDVWRGIVVDSAGIGSSIAANKVPGVRAALCYDSATARNSREHNDANVLSLGAKMITAEGAIELLAIFLETPFGGGRHARRVDKIVAIEKRYGKSAGK